MRGRVLIAAIAALALAFVGGNVTAGPVGQEVPLQARDSVFDPYTLTVDQGTTVTWSHLGRLTHTVTSDDGLFDSTPMDIGATFSVKFNASGTFRYYCQFHGRPGAGMSGTVVVRPRIGTPIEPAADATPESEPTASTEPPVTAPGDPPPGPDSMSEDLPNVGEADGTPWTLLILVGVLALTAGYTIRRRASSR